MDAMEPALLDWLLEQDNPAVRLRALTGLCGARPDDPRVADARRAVLNWLPQARDTAWMAGEHGLSFIYDLLALAECGLTAEDIDLKPALAQLAGGRFDAGCGDAMLVRALVMLGCMDEPAVMERLAGFAHAMLQDGGFLCLHRLAHMKYQPKSCIKADMHALMMLAELHNRGFDTVYTGRLLGYFLRRRVFYRSDAPTALVLNCQKGRRMTDNFFPAEAMRVGLPQLLYAFSALGAGGAPELREAWAMLEGKRDSLGRYVLEGTLPRSYLPKERVGRPGKWVTLYAMLAMKYLKIP